MTPTQCDEFRREIKHLAVDCLPVEPSDLVVLTVGVVVAPLSAPELVAPQQQRYARREQQRHKKCALLPRAEGHYGWIVGWALGSTVPRAVVVGAVAVALTVGIVVLVVVRDQVGQGEAVVHGDEVDRCAGSASFIGPVVDVSRTAQARSEIAQQPVMAAPPVARGVAEASVPFAPQRREATDVVTIHAADVPRLGDELDL